MKLILKSAKVYLHTTMEEHFGTSIVEAMAMGWIRIVHNSRGSKNSCLQDTDMKIYKMPQGK